MINGAQIFPKYPSLPQIPTPSPLGNGASIGNNPLTFNNVSNTTSTLDTFNSLLSETSKEIQKPHKLAEQMIKGEREFDSADLMVSMLEAEKKLNMSVRVINDIVKGIKQLEQIQV